jgi:hypothetical protein
MPTFQIGQSVKTSTNTVSVDVDANNPLPKGTHIFQLVVVDDDGLVSDPVQFSLVVLDDRKPTAVIDGPSSVQLGQSFTLDGSRSVDLAPGRIVEFVWTLLR